MKQLEQSVIRRYTLVLGMLWTVIIVLATTWVIQKQQEKTLQLANTQARAHMNKDQALRLWSTRHGFIYVPISDHFQPDPLMVHLPERDIQTPSGVPLTLLNPAHIIYQLDQDFGHLYGVSGKVTSLDPISERNRPDEWEQQALKRLLEGEKEVLELVETNGTEYLRLMEPLVVKPGCLLCHAEQGFEVGKTGGGIRINLPMTQLRALESAAIQSNLFTIAGLWLFGLMGLGLGFLLTNRQETARKEAVRELHLSEQRANAVIETSFDCIVTIDHNDHIMEFNPAAEQTFGYRREQVLGKPMADLLIPESLRDQHREGLRRHLEKGTSSMLGSRVEILAMRADGSEFPVELAINRIERQDHPLFTAYLRDITARQEMQKQLLRQASQDDLTGLFNRHTFEQALKRLTATPSSNGHCLMYLDLDRFKLVNDTCGHSAGDRLLRQLSELFEDTVAERGTLGRLGGDEFGLLLENQSLDQGSGIAQELLDAVSSFHFDWQDRSFALGLSIGLVPLDRTEQEASRLLSLADAACYRAKQEGRNRFYVYTWDDDDPAGQGQSELHWLNRIEAAFAGDRFQLYQQPIFRVNNPPPSRPYCMELLLRMQGEDGRLVRPDQFLPAAKRYHLMPTIDRWVVRNALQWLARHASLGIVISINLSGASLNDPLFLDFVLSELETNNIPKGSVCLEITETVAITNLTDTKRFIARLHGAGCIFALDDFGSGMSSFGYLKDLAVDYLKIDGRFVRDMDIDPVSLAMVRSINEVGQIMGKQTIAEFVSHEAVLELLREMGVDHAQGYYLGEPEPLASFSPESDARERAV